jgi:hypothetical protein
LKTSGSFDWLGSEKDHDKCKKLKGKMKADVKEQITVVFLFCGKEKEKGFGVPKPLCFIYYILRLISYPLPFNPYPLTPP